MLKKFKRQRKKRGLITLQGLQQRYSSCNWITGQVAMAKQELIMAEKVIYHMEFHGSTAHWIQVGDKTTKEFFRSKGRRHARTVMHSLNRDDGSITEDGEEMRNIPTSYYKCMLTENSMATGEDTREDIIF